MFQAFDTHGPNKPAIPRREWMALLSRAPLQVLEEALSEQADHELQWLRKPETGLYMVQGRAGGTGERFNLGEITVTRCTLRVEGDGSPVGVAYVMGRNHRQVQLAAMADAMLQNPSRHDELADKVLQPVRQYLAKQEALRAARAQSTKVDFFTVAREAGGSDEEDEG